MRAEKGIFYERINIKEYYKEMEEKLEEEEEVEW